MKKKQIFSLRVFLETLNRLKLPGIIFAVILILEAILLPLSYVINSTAPEGEITASTISALEAHPLLFLLLIASPILTYTAFSFLNKRSASDFFHSLPHTRFSIFTSITSAVFAWILGIGVVSTGLSRLTLALFPAHFSVISGTYLPFFITCIVSAFLLSAVVIIAMSITGTILNNVVLSGLILCLPRYVILFITEGLLANFPLLPRAYISELLTLNVNTVTGIGSYIIGANDGSISNIFTPVPQIYTAALTLLYLVIGAILFCRRRSESAERSAPSRFMQAVYRITVATVVCVPICFLIFTGDVNPITDAFTIFILYLLAVLAYFVYELITTKKWKNLISSIPGLLIVALINVLLLGAMSVITISEESFLPAPDEIEYVQVMNEYGNGASLYDDFMYPSNFVEFPQYADSLSSEVKISDPKVLEIVSSSLEETVKYVAYNGSVYNLYYGDYAKYPEYEDEDKIEVYTFKIKTATGTKYRKVRIHQDDSKYIMDTLSASPEYTEAWMTLPDPQRGTVQLTYAYECIRGDEAEAILKIMKEELKTVDFTRWHDFAVSYKGNFGTISYSVGKLTLYVNIDASLFPKTVQAMLDASRRNEDMTFEDLKEEMTGASMDFIDMSYVNLWTYSEKTGEYTSEYLEMDFYFEHDKELVFKDLLKVIVDGEARYGETFIEVNLYTEETDIIPEKPNLTYYEEHTFFFPVVENYEEILAEYKVD